MSLFWVFMLMVGCVGLGYCIGRVQGNIKAEKLLAHFMEKHDEIMVLKDKTLDMKEDLIQKLIKQRDSYFTQLLVAMRSK